MPNPSAEPKETLCLLSFTEDGAVRWKTSIGSASQEFVHRMIHVCRASLAISSAFLSITGETAASDVPSRVNQRGERKSEKAAFVQCENDTVILAKRLHHTPDMWFALIGRPLILRGDTVCQEVLNTLEELAGALFPAPSGGEGDLYEMCNSIIRSLMSTPLWSDRGRISYFMDSLVRFCESNAQRIKRSHSVSLDSDPVSPSGFHLALGRPLEAFRTAVSRQFDASQMRLCVLSADMKPLYSEKFRRREAELLGWYFSTCLKLGLRAFSNFLSERGKRGVLHVWYQRHGLILFTDLPCSTADSGESSRSLRYAADALIDAASRAVVKQ